MRIIILVFAFTFLFPSCATSKTETNKEKSVKTVEIKDNSTIVCFGDSLTYGHGADSATESWPALLQKRVKIPVINSGRNDDTTADGLLRFDRMLKRLEKDYGVTIIWDAWNGAWGHKDCKFDMTHCNAKGYKMMEENIFNVLEPFLKENDLLIRMEK